MKIRTQLIAGTVIFALLLIIISGLIFSTNQQLDKLMAQEDLANRITLEVSELGYLSNDYILYREPLQADRWNAKFTSVSTDIAHLDLSAPDGGFPDPENPVHPVYPCEFLPCFQCVPW